MARIAQGRAFRAFPILTEGFNDYVWAKSGHASVIDGVTFMVTGEVQKALGVRELIKWDATEYPFGANTIDAISNLNVTRGPNELVIAHSGLVEFTARNQTEGIANSRSIPRQPSEGEFFAAHAGWLFFCNGVDGNLKWNGDYAAEVGVSEIPTAPSAAQLEDAAFPVSFSIAAAAVPATFQYRRTFVSSSGHEGPPSTVGGASVVPTSATNPCIVRITGLAAPLAGDLVWQNIYKRAKDGVYFLWRRLSVHEDVCYDYEDPLDTGAEGGVVLDELKSAPPTAKLIEFFRGRGYYVPVASPSFIIFSYPGKAEEVSPLNFLEVSSSDGEPITAMVHFFDMLVIFKKSSVWTITARPDGSPVLAPVDTGIGCIAPRSVIRLYDRLLFVGRHGLYSFDGGSVRPVTNRLTRWWRQLAPDYLPNACAVHDEANRRVVFAVPLGTKSFNDTLLTYHYDIGKEAWAMTSGHRIHALHSYKDMVIAGVVDDAGKANLVLLDGSYGGDVTTYNSEGTAAGTSKAWTATGTIRFGPYGQKDTFSADERLEIHGIDVWYRYTGSHALKVNVYKDRLYTVDQTRSFNLNKFGTLANKSGNQNLTTLNGWNEKDWGQDTWSGDRLLFQRVQFPSPISCREFEVEFVGDSADEPYEIAAFTPWFARKGSETKR